jgi:hypothetical protein
LPQSAPNVDPALVIATGATQLRDVFSAEELPRIITACIHGLKAVWAVATEFVGFATIWCAVIPWSRLPTHVSQAGDGEDAVDLKGEKNG